jgi:hypothetical protein
MTPILRLFDQLIINQSYYSEGDGREELSIVFILWLDIVDA